MKILWVDDLRDPYVFMNFKQDVTWAKTYESAIKILTNEDFDIIYLDNDLGNEDGFQGKHVFNYIEELLYFKKQCDLTMIYIHSDNSSAVRTMLSAKDNIKIKYNVDMEQIIFNKVR